MNNKEKRIKRLRRKLRTRSKVRGNSDRPRISVFRSSNHLFAQVINDDKGETVVSASDLEVSKKEKGTKKEISFKLGELLAAKAMAKKIKQAVFDKGGYKYHGRIQSLVEGMRKGGINI